MKLSETGLPVLDLDYILDQTKTLWKELCNKRIFITGGTGFFGCWLLESFVWANRILNLNASAVILTRNPAQFAKKCPHLFIEPSLTFHAGDVQDFKFPHGEFSYLIHAATETASSLNIENPQLLFDSIVQGTAHTLEFARQAGVNKFLLISSGAVYGKQPSTVSHITEDYLVPGMNGEGNESAYALGKRKAEEICAQYAERFNLTIKIARCFAFVGPYLPLDAHFAIGNFIRDGLKQSTIVVNGDGSPYRSYLYAADLTVFLWTILFCGQAMRPYNVGSDEALTIGEIAHRVAKSFQSDIEVHIKQPAARLFSERYVPDMKRTKEELGLTPAKNLDQAIHATINWYKYLEMRNDAN